MYQTIQIGRKSRFVFIAILALFFVTIYGNNKAFAADARFKSEEELLEETRINIEKHLDEEARSKASPDSVQKEPADQIEEKQIVAEQPAVEKNPTPEGKPSVIEENTAVVERKPAVAKEEIVPVKKEKAPIKQETAPVKKEEAPIKEETAPVNQKAATSDVAQVNMNDVNIDKDINQPPAEELVYSGKLKKSIVKPGAEEPILKKMDVNRIGASPYYETYEGLRLLKYFTVAQRVEIYQEPRPIDSYILDANAMRYLYHNTPWNQKADYRTQLVPVFTRAYGTEITFSDPKNKEGQIRYTHDYRNIYRNYFPKYDYNDLQGNESGIKEETWDQNEIMLLHAKDIEPIGWLYTSNWGYRYSTMSAKSDPTQTAPYYPYYEVRHTYLGSLSLAPSSKLEYFFQGEYYKSMHVKSSWAYSPDHFMGRTEMRVKSNDMRTNFVPSFSYSKDFYYPGDNWYEKYEIAFRVGRDWTKKFSTTTTIQYVYSGREEPDNQAPLYAAGYYNAHKDKAEYISMQNRFAYNVYDRLYVQAGLDLNNGINWSIFDNWALLGGLEYYAPGIIRVDVGWVGNDYYNLANFMSSVYFKFYLFM